MRVGSGAARAKILKRSRTGAKDRPHAVGVVWYGSDLFSGEQKREAFLRPHCQQRGWGKLDLRPTVVGS